MKRNKKTLATILFLLLLAFCGGNIYCAYLSQWSSTSKVKGMLLGLTPLGSSVEHVKSVIQVRKWKQCYEKQFAESERSRNFFPGVKGSYAVGVNFGRHGAFPFSYWVDAYWGFDSSGKLIDINVRQMADAAL